MPDKKPKRKHYIHLHFCVDEEERNFIQERMASTGIVSLGAFMRKMAIDGYHINIDLTDVRDLVSLLRRCSNNLNQVIHCVECRLLLCCNALYYRFLLVCCLALYRENALCSVKFAPQFYLHASGTA